MAPNPQDSPFETPSREEYEKLVARLRTLPKSPRLAGLWSEDDDRAFDLAYQVFVLAEHDR